jgi:hypothetical protein
MATKMQEKMSSMMPTMPTMPMKAMMPQPQSVATPAPTSVPVTNTPTVSVTPPPVVAPTPQTVIQLSAPTADSKGTSVSDVKQSPTTNKSGIYDPTKPLGGVKMPVLPVDIGPNTPPIGLVPIPMPLPPEVVPILGAVRFFNVTSLNRVILNGTTYKVKDPVKDSTFIVKKIKETSVILLSTQTKKELEIKIIR